MLAGEDRVFTRDPAPPPWPTSLASFVQKYERAIDNWGFCNVAGKRFTKLAVAIRYWDWCDEREKRYGLRYGNSEAAAKASRERISGDGPAQPASLPATEPGVLREARDAEEAGSRLP